MSGIWSSGIWVICEFYSGEGLLSTYEETSGLVFLFLRNR